MSKDSEEFELAFIDFLHRFDFQGDIVTEVDTELVTKIAEYLMETEELESSYKEDPTEVLRIALFIYGFIKDEGVT